MTEATETPGTGHWPRKAKKRKTETIQRKSKRYRQPKTTPKSKCKLRWLLDEHNSTKEKENAEKSPEQSEANKVTIAKQVSLEQEKERNNGRGRKIEKEGKEKKKGKGEKKRKKRK